VPEHSLATMDESFILPEVFVAARKRCYVVPEAFLVTDKVSGTVQEPSITSYERELHAESRLLSREEGLWHPFSGVSGSEERDLH
jgi:hypothetical protein